MELMASPMIHSIILTTVQVWSVKTLVTRALLTHRMLCRAGTQMVTPSPLQRRTHCLRTAQRTLRGIRKAASYRTLVGLEGRKLIVTMQQASARLSKWTRVASWSVFQRLTSLVMIETGVLSSHLIWPSLAMDTQCWTVTTTWMVWRCPASSIVTRWLVANSQVHYQAFLDTSSNHSSVIVASLDKRMRIILVSFLSLQDRIYIGHY